MDDLRVAMIGQRGVPAAWGGIERHVEEIGTRLVERGVQVTVYCRPNYVDHGASTYRGMDLVSVDTIGTKHLDAIVHSARSTIRSLRGFDIVHYHALGPGILAPVPRALSRAKVVQTIHGRDDQRGKWSGIAQAVLRAALWTSVHVPDAVVTVSEDLAEYYRREQGREVIAISNGTPPAHPLPPDDITRTYGLSGEDYLLFVGRFVPEKAPDVLIEAFRDLDTDHRLVLAGDSSFTDEYVSRLRAMADGDDRIVFTGYVHGDRLTELYSNAALFVLPSLLEGLPLTLLEAIGNGRPIVASSIAPHVEVLRTDGPGHRLVPPGDVSALRTALAQALQDPAAETRGIEPVVADVRARYDWDLATDQLLCVYRDLVEGGDGTGHDSGAAA